MIPADVPERLAGPLRRHLAGETSTGLAIAALAMAADDPAEVPALLSRLAATDPRLAALSDLAARHPDAPAAIRAVLEAVDHRPDPGAGAEAVMARLAAGFDRAVAVDPSISVALYSLGDEARLAETTAEVVGWLDGAGLVAGDRPVLEIGCGIGRFAPAVAARGLGYLGLDIAPGMVEKARSRTAGLPGVSFRVGSGHDLSAVPDGSVGLVLAVDSFPYLVQAGGEIPVRCIQECARVLAPGAPAVVLNWSYRGDLPGDVAEADALAGRVGLRLETAGARPFRGWDGAAFVLRKPL